SVLNSIANGVLRMFGVEPKSEVSATFTAEGVASIVARSQAEGILEDEVGLLSGALEFSGSHAGDVMVPLDGVVSLPSGGNIAEVDAAVARTGFSRLPVHTDAPKIIQSLRPRQNVSDTTA